MDYHDENDFLHSLSSFNLELLKNFAAGRVVKFLPWKFKIMHAARRILERLGIQRLHHRLSKFDRSAFLNLKPIYYFFGVYMACFFLSRNSIGVS